MVAEPTITVRVAFESSPFSTSPTWVDISEYVEDFTTNLGRESEIGSIEAGVAELTLDNSDGRFTPNRVASPYYPNVRPRRPIWITADLTDEFDVTTTYNLFRGMIERFPATTEFGATKVTVPCVDGLTLIAKTKLEKPFIHELRKRNPVEIYPCNDESTSFYYGLIDPANNRLHAAPAATKNLFRNSGGGDAPVVKPQQESILPNGTGLGSVQVEKTSEVTTTINGTEYQVSSGAPIFSDNRFTLDTTSASNGWMISLFHQYNAHTNTTEEGNDNSGTCLVCRVQPDHESAFLVELVYESNGTEGIAPYYELAWRGPDSAGVATFDSFVDDNSKLSTSETAGNHVAFGFKPDLHDDGSMVPAVGYFVNGTGSWTEVASDSKMLDREVSAGLIIGSAYFPTRESFGDPGRYQLMSHDYNLEMVSVHDEWWSPADVQEIKAASAGYPDQTVPERLGLLLDQINWPLEWRDLDATDDGTLVKFIGWEGNPNTLDELRVPVLDANGLLFMAPDGKLTYQSRHRRVNPEPEFTFDATNGTGVESPVDFDMAEDDIVNVMDIDNAYGVKATVRNETSVSEYGESSATATLRLSSDDEAIDFGRWRVNRFGSAQLRVDGLTLNPSAHGTGGLWSAALGLNLSSVIELAGLPDSAPDEGLIYFVEKIGHEVTRQGSRLGWLVNLQVSPASNRGGWILGDPAYGRLGTSTRLHY